VKAAPPKQDVRRLADSSGTRTDSKLVTRLDLIVALTIPPDELRSATQPSTAA
jgi:hypothetical protein